MDWSVNNKTIIILSVLEFFFTKMHCCKLKHAVINWYSNDAKYQLCVFVTKFAESHNYLTKKKVYLRKML